jgi:hypothetical protein
VECFPYGRKGPKAAVCWKNNIKSYPTWIIGGRKYKGMLWPCFPDIPAFNEGRVGMGIKTATEDLSNEASTGWKPVEASLVSLTGNCYLF